MSMFIKMNIMNIDTVDTEMDEDRDKVMDTDMDRGRNMDSDRDTDRDRVSDMDRLLKY
jgi:hypothetical protein